MQKAKKRFWRAGDVRSTIWRKLVACRYPEMQGRAMWKWWVEQRLDLKWSGNRPDPKEVAREVGVRCIVFGRKGVR